MSRVVLAVVLFFVSVTPMVHARELKQVAAPDGVAWHANDVDNLRFTLVSGGSMADGSYAVYGKKSINGTESAEHLFGTVVVTGGVVTGQMAVTGLYHQSPTWQVPTTRPPWTAATAYSTVDHISNGSVWVTKVMRAGVEIGFSAEVYSTTLNFYFSRTGYSAPAVTTETVTKNITLGPPVGKKLKLRYNYRSWCSDPSPLTFFLGDGQTATFTPVSGTQASPSADTYAEHTFVPAAVMAGVGNRGGVRTSTGAEIWSFIYPVDVDGLPLVFPEDIATYSSGFSTIACDEVPSAPVTTGPSTDNTTGAQTTATNTTSTPSGAAPGSATTTNTQSSTTPAPTPSNPTPEPVKKTIQDTKYLGTGNPQSGDMTKQDFYDAVKQSLLDAGNTQGGFGALGGSVGASPGVFQFGDGTLVEFGDLQGGVDAQQAAKGAARDGVLGKLGGMSGVLENVPTSLGTVSVVSLGTVASGSQSFAVAWDFTKVASGISIARQIMYWVITLLFVLKCVQTIGDTLGGKGAA